MANVQGKFYTAETQRRGVTPSSPPNAVDDPQDPISPSSPVSFISLTDTPSSYSGQTLKGVRVNAGETGLEFYTVSSGGLPPIDGSYASQALMIADQANQTAQYIYFDSVQYWEYLGTTTPSIADYRAISAGGSSNWTVVGADIYRNSQVTIGQTTIISADLGVNQINTLGAFRLDSLPKSTRRDVITMYEDGITKRFWLDNYGIPIWKLWTGAAEGGALTFSTPTDRIGILTATSDSFTSSERGYISWNNVDHNCFIGVNNTTRFYINNGYFGFNTAGSATQTFQIRGVTGHTILFNAINVAGTEGILTVYDSGYAYAKNLQTANFTGTTARQWKLGELKTVASTFDGTRHVTVEINGVVYKLAVVT